MMSKLCKRKYSKACVTAMVWTEMPYQTWLQRYAKIFGGKNLVPCQVANNIVFFASRLKDDRKASLIV